MLLFYNKKMRPAEGNSFKYILPKLQSRINKHHFFSKNSGRDWGMRYWKGFYSDGEGSAYGWEGGSCSVCWF
jgi:hypothetical protein